MGVVYAATDPLIGRPVAIKTVRVSDIQEEKEREQLRHRLRREAQAAGILSHPAIVTIHDVGEQEELTYIVMEFIDGTNLEEILSSGAPQHTDTLFRILRQTAEGLDYAHSSGLVHRDIKPSNIMIARDGTAKIADFGVAKFSASTTMTQTGLVLGTPNYVSPEQAKGGMVDGRSDQFSLAVVACRMLAGKLPFSGPTLTVVLTKLLWEEPEFPEAGLKPEVQKVLRRGLEKDPRKRYSTCVEFVEELARARQVRKRKLSDRLPSQQEPGPAEGEASFEWSHQSKSSETQRLAPVEATGSGTLPQEISSPPAAPPQNEDPPSMHAECYDADSAAQPGTLGSAHEEAVYLLADKEPPLHPPDRDDGPIPEMAAVEQQRTAGKRSTFVMPAVVSILVLVAAFVAYRSLSHRSAAVKQDVAKVSSAPAPSPSPMAEASPTIARPIPESPKVEAGLQKRETSTRVGSPGKATRTVASAGEKQVKMPVVTAPRARQTGTPEERVAAVPSRAAAPSGVLSWSGRMQKNSILVIDGQKASHGFIEGQLPGVPVKIQIDPQTVEVREYPSRENSWKRLILYSGQQKHSSITIRWIATQ